MTPERLAVLEALDLGPITSTKDELIAEVRRLQAEVESRNEDIRRLQVLYAGLQAECDGWKDAAEKFAQLYRDCVVPMWRPGPPTEPGWYWAFDGHEVWCECATRGRLHGWRCFPNTCSVTHHMPIAKPEPPEAV